MQTVTVTPGEIEISEADLPNGKFWRLSFSDEDGVAHVTFTTEAFRSFLSQISAINRELGH